MCNDESCRHHTADDDPDPGRRALLRTGLIAGAATALTLAPISFAAADAPAPTSGTDSRTITGHLDTGVADFVHLPVEVPHGVQQIAVSYSYDKPTVPAGVPGNSCDIGIFDERGTELGGAGFRGWSGGFRTSFAISNGTATPGYLPGPVRAGTWHVVLGLYTPRDAGQAVFA
ncbi:hypothetical protein [Kitasatospora sp. GAS1066B]|uniref:hypothetical protein n=1 Tax=Kitasatospora sp. GAS1066B TaxID=3156271 RepID=UPI00351678BC